MVSRVGVVGFERGGDQARGIELRARSTSVVRNFRRASPRGVSLATLHRMTDARFLSREIISVSCCSALRSVSGFSQEMVQ